MEINVLREILERHRQGERIAVGLLCHVQGSAPQKAGARLIVLPDGRMRGTVGGGCLEMETRRRALLALRSGETTLFDLRLDDDFGWDDGLICGGKTRLLVCPHPERMAQAFVSALQRYDRGERSWLVTRLTDAGEEKAGETHCFGSEAAVAPFLETDGSATAGERPVFSTLPAGRFLIEPVRPAPRLYVCGCGHIGAALVQFAASVGFDVTAIDDRADYADRERLPGVREARCMDMVEAATTLPTSQDTYWVIVTRGHRNDGRVLAAMIGRPHAYVGMIGSRRKVRIIKEGLQKEGIATAEQLERLHAPIGLDIGGESPQEIALSIVAQLVAVRHGRIPRAEPPR